MNILNYWQFLTVAIASITVSIVLGVAVVWCLARAFPRLRGCRPEHIVIDEAFRLATQARTFWVDGKCYFVVPVQPKPMTAEQTAALKAALMGEIR